MNIFDILAAALAGIGTGLVGWVYTFPYFILITILAQDKIKAKMVITPKALLTN